MNICNSTNYFCFYPSLENFPNCSKDVIKIKIMTRKEKRKSVVSKYSNLATN